MKYLRATAVLDAHVGDELVAFDTERGVYHHLNPTGMAIWEALETPLSEAELVAAMVDRYGADTGIIEGETRMFLHGLVEKHIVVAVDDSAP